MMEATGKSDPNVTEAMIRNSPLGQAGVNDYYHNLSGALDRFNTQGALARYSTPDAAAAGLSSVKDIAALPKTIGSTDDFNSLANAVTLVESHGNPAARVVDSHGVEHLGTMQVSVALARQIAPQATTGMSDQQVRASLLAPDQQLNQQVGRGYLQQQLVHYHGDPFLAANAFHAGPGNVDKWIGAYGDPRTNDITPGDWMSAVKAAGNPASAQYGQLVANAMQGGKAWTAYAGLQDQSGPWAVARQGFVSDPIDYARTHSMAAPAPLALNGFAPGQDNASWAAALKQRQTVGATLAGKYGVPARILTSGEASSYGDQLSQNPAAGPALAGAAMRALGQQGATEFLHEIGQTGSAPGVGMQAALLAAGGRTQAVAAVQAGLQAKAAGARDAPAPKAPGQHDPWEAAVAPLRSAFGSAPGALGAVEATAQTMHLGDSQTRAPDNPAAYIRAAMGGWTNPRTGQSFGGVAPVNGVQTVHPPWMLNGAMPAALRLIGDNAGANGPQFSNGQPMRGADLARLQPRLQADGTYEMFDPRSGKIAGVAGGAPYRIDFDAARPMLAHAGGIEGHD